VLSWYPTYGHPSGPAIDAWFDFDGALGYRAATHPEGPSQEAVLHLRDALVYRIGVPEHTPPWFEIVGSFVYLFGHGGAPWYWSPGWIAAARNAGS
jgi:hypothetical protein